MRNRSSTGVLSSLAPHLAGELQSNLCLYSMHVCTKQDLILFFIVVIVCKDHCRGYFTAPTSHPSGRGVPIQPAVCHMYKKYCVCYSIVPSSDLYHVPCTTYLVSCTTCPVPRAPYLAARTSYLAPCISYLVPRTLYLLLSTLYFV
jgi:hypothetical protein